MTSNAGNHAVARVDVIEAVTGLLESKARSDGPAAAQSAAFGMILAALRHLLEAEGEAATCELLAGLLEQLGRKLRGAAEHA